MMKKIISVLLICLVGLTVCAPAFAAIPKKKDKLAGVTVQSNDKATVDTSNAAEGFVLVKYTAGKAVPVKVQVQKGAGTLYTYNLNNAGNFEAFPLTDGNGDYAVKIFEHIEGTRYALAYSCTINVKLRDPLLPFLYTNQYVSYTSDSQTAKTAAEITKNSKDNLEKVNTVYNYVVDTLTYDHDLAARVTSDYLPNVDAVLKAKKGICFDYAALMSAMLRSQDVPCKLVVGYAGEVYHAWIDVYIENIGWVDQAIYFDGKSWSLMDPTYISSSGRDASAVAFVKDKTNYTTKYIY